MKNKIQRIGIAGLLFAGVTLFSGCVEKTDNPKIPESTKKLVITAAKKGYEFGANGDSWESISNKIVVILDSR